MPTATRTAVSRDITPPSPPSVPEAALTVSGLSKSYRTGFWLDKVVTPLQDCTLAVAQGETFGLLGPNGAGKTTTIKCLLGIVNPSSGSGTILGKPLGHAEIKQRIGYLPENPYFYDYLTGWEFLTFAGQLFRVPDAILRDRIPELLDEVGLPIEAARKKQMRNYSKGMLQRVGLAQALINDPDLVFLDEPMSGLDPTGRYQIREIILKLKRRGKTVFFNSHILADVEVICDRVALLVQGRIVAQGPLDELLSTSPSYQVRGEGGNLEALQARLQNWTMRYGRPEVGDRKVVWQGIWTGSPEDCTACLKQHGAQLLDLHLQRQTLEEFFLTHVQSTAAGPTERELVVK
jgi:ABC-2 type transport system ATP-binding protein